jgi:Ca-activated chloride channel family protein
MLLLVSVLALTACGGAASTTPAESVAASQSEAASVSASPSTDPGTGEPSVTAPDEVDAGAQFDVDWTGPNAEGDFVTIVAAGVTEWTNEPYFYTSDGSPGSLTAPIGPGSYTLLYMSGEDRSILAQQDITVLPFEGDLLAADEVEAGTVFEVAWNGPDASGDYVTIVAVGAEQWTNEPYFYTGTGNPGQLQAPIEAGEYELWYVPGTERAPSATRPITVTPYQASVEAPQSVDRGETFDVEWTGPDGPGDYITIVPAGADDREYLSYAYTGTGSPVEIVAPDQKGSYEVRYVTAAYKVLASTEVSVE